ncbi:MAG: lactonase family protein [Nitrospiraceae bacterium]|nr:lactonase family protein [Nitrospiraceae bacterium]
MYVANGSNNNVIGFTVNGLTGALTSMGGSPFAAGSIPIGVTIHSSGQFLYAANSGSGSVSAYTISTGTGALTPLNGALGNPFSAGTGPVGITTPR